MFLSAVARPRYLPHHHRWFDGLIGIYPVGEMGVYERNSRLHKVGDPKWKNMTMDRDRYRKMMIEQVLPDVKAKMPSCTKILIQQDGAKSHLLERDVAFEQKVEELFGDVDAVELKTQPAQSPDLNVNDLGFFCSLQSHYYQHSPKDSIDLINMVKQAFASYPCNTLNRIWLSLQQCMNEIIEHRGDNNYKLPHMNKDRLERLGVLPTVLEVTQEAQQYQQVSSIQQDVYSFSLFNTKHTVLFCLC